MRKSPKVQDTLEIFYEKFEVMDKRFQKLSEQLPMIEGKYEEFKQIKLQIDSSDLENKLLKLNELQENHFLKWEKASNVHFDKVTKYSQQFISSQVYYILGTAILFLICIALTFYAIYQNSEKREIEKNLEFYKREAISRNQYLKEKNLIKKYENWKHK